MSNPAMPVFDLHCDTLAKLGRSGTLDGTNAHVSLEGLRRGGVALQCFACFVPTGLFPKPLRGTLSRARFNKLYKNYQRMMQAHAGTLFPVLTASDVDRAGQDGRTGVLLTIEDGGVMGNRLEQVKKYYDLGVRLVTLTWNHPNPIGYPHSKNPADMSKGLTEYGRQVVYEMERLGMAVDVSHASDGVFYDVAKLASKPFVASHSNARAVCPHTRNMTDDMIRTLADRGGIMGLNLCPAFVGGDQNHTRMEDLVRQVLHIRRVGGSGILALGSDFDGIGGQLDVAGPQDWPRLAQALAEAGVPGSELEMMWSGNARRVLREALTPRVKA